MANLPISSLTASAANATATDIAPIVQTTGVGPVKMTMQQIAGGLLGSSSFNAATIVADSPVLNLAQTWNNAAITFTGWKFNVTNTASNAASLLMDLQIGGTSRFVVDKVVVVGTTLTETDSLLDPPEFTAFNFTVYVVPFVKRVTPSDDSFVMFTGL